VRRPSGSIRVAVEQDGVDFLPGRDARLWRRLATVHHVSAAVWLTLVVLGADAVRPWQVLLIALAVLGSETALRWWAERRAAVPSWVFGVDQLGMAFAVAIVPDTAAISAAFMLAGLGLAATVLRWRPLIGLWSLYGVLVVVGVAWRDVDDAVGVAAAMLGAAAVLAVNTHLVARSLGRFATHQREVLDSLDAIVWEELPDVDGAMRVTSRAVALLGYPTSAWERPGFWRSITHPDDLPAVEAEIDAAIREQRGQAIELRFRHATGSWRWFENRVSLVRDRTGRSAYRGVMVDTTATHAAQDLADRLAETFRSSPLAQAIMRFRDPDDRASLEVVVSNQAAIEFFGNAAPAGTHQAVGDVMGSVPDLRRTIPLVWWVRTTGAEQTGVAVLDDGRRARATCRPMANGHYYVSIEDVTAQAEAEAELLRRATFDELTGLLNRVTFGERLDALLAGAGSEPVAVLLLDLDQFKEVNDALGHPVGDRLLAVVAERLTTVIAEVAPAALLGRLGGDEFAIGCAAPPATVERLAERIVDVVGAPVPIDTIVVGTAASVGIARAPIDGTTTDALLRAADVAMYAAKRRGGGVQHSTQLDDVAAVRRLRLIADLRTAIDHDEFELWYQPVVSTVDATMHHVEALVRWQHPEFGLVMPAEFVELVEVTGLATALTRWVVTTALRDAARFDAVSSALGRPLGMSCNLSARNLYERDLADWLGTTLVASPPPSGGLTLELTETAVFDDGAAGTTLFDALADLGVKIWLDDFGTGYSSLVQLRSYRFAGLKIDRSFVTGLLDSDDDTAIVESTIELAHRLGLAVIAEGVEDHATFARLAAAGCDLAQGFHLGRPMPAADLLESLQLASIPTAPEQSGA
jgi:diguanylate cyclase (GGDEF)-like protein/PAS domain S-box-containing protein